MREWGARPNRAKEDCQESKLKCKPLPTIVHDHAAEIDQREVKEPKAEGKQERCDGGGREEEGQKHANPRDKLKDGIIKR